MSDPRVESDSSAFSPEDNEKWHKGQDERAYVWQMKRLLLGLGGLYVLFAVIGRFVEAMGAVSCECAPDCWCHRPALSLFRWVFPRGHRCS